MGTNLNLGNIAFRVPGVPDWWPWLESLYLPYVSSLGKQLFRECTLIYSCSSTSWMIQLATCRTIWSMVNQALIRGSLGLCHGVLNALTKLFKLLLVFP